MALVSPDVRSYRIVGRPIYTVSFYQYGIMMTWIAGTDGIGMGTGSFFVRMGMGMEMKLWGLGGMEKIHRDGVETRKTSVGWGREGDNLFHHVTV